MATNPIERSDPQPHDTDSDPRIGPNVSPEHRAILEAALAQPVRKGSFNELLASMPDVGLDSDFERRHG